LASVGVSNRSLSSNLCVENQLSHRGVVVAVTAPAHAAGDSVRGKALAILLTGIRTALVRMMKQSGLRVPPRHRVLEPHAFSREEGLGCFRISRSIRSPAVLLAQPRQLRALLCRKAYLPITAVGACLGNPQSQARSIEAQVPRHLSDALALIKDQPHRTGLELIRERPPHPRPSAPRFMRPIALMQVHCGRSHTQHPASVGEAGGVPYKTGLRGSGSTRHGRSPPACLPYLSLRAPRTFSRCRRYSRASCLDAT